MSASGAKVINTVFQKGLTFFCWSFLEGVIAGELCSYKLFRKRSRCFNGLSSMDMSLQNAFSG